MARGLSAKTDTKDEIDMPKIKEDYDMDSEDSDDNTKLKAEMAKILRLSKIENERDMDSSSTEDYAGIDTSESESESEKELTFNKGTYEKAVAVKQSTLKNILGSGPYDKPSTSSIPPTFKPTQAKDNKGQLRSPSSSDSDSDEKNTNTRKMRDEKPGTSKRAKISDGEENYQHKATVEDDNEAENKGLNDMPLSERDKFLFSQHVKNKKKKEEEERIKQEREADDQNTNEKSKSCVVM